MKTTVSLLVGTALIIGVGGMTYWQYKDAPASATPESGTSNESISTASVASHKDATSCWSSINGNVYDLTSWIPEHPGGPQAILQLCGTDGTAKFNGMHGGGAMQEQILAGFKIGILAQ
jgi:cytochrome b involved in lipid metabolism